MTHKLYFNGSFQIPLNVRKIYFVSNRLKDIKGFEQEIFKEHGIPINFKYVSTDSNPADLLTRGLSLDSFQQNMKFWLQGPDFINADKVEWPIY